MAGFYVVGVDINPQPRYCGDEFHQADAMTFPLDGFDVIHASPPCQCYSTASPRNNNHPDLYKPTLDRLTAAGVPYVIENVIGAPYGHGVVLCGTMFGLEADGEWLRRHRNFETSFLIFQPQHHHRKDKRACTITGHCFLSKTKDCARHSRQSTFETGKKLMGIDWMDRRELANAIPPAYTFWIGQQLMEYLENDRAENSKAASK